MSETKAQKMVARLLSNSAGLMYGSVSITAKIHAGRILDVFYNTTESMREVDNKKEDVKTEDN
jgi:hypothetical protein